MKIYHAPMTRSIRVIWTCEELQLPYERIDIDFSPQFRATREWRALNPVGKVPVLQDGDLTMFESGAMVQYVLDRHGAGRLQPPAGTAAHAIYLQWSWFAEATFARPLGEVFNHRRAFPGPNEKADVIAEMTGRARACCVALDEAVDGKQFLLGDEFSAADIMTGYSLFLAEKVAPFDDLAHLTAYWQRLITRPAYRVAIA